MSMTAGIDSARAPWSSSRPAHLFLVSGLLVACQGQVVETPEHGGAGSGGAVADVVCEGATPVLAAAGYDSGFVLCPDGVTTRARAVTCDTTVDEPACGGDES